MERPSVGQEFIDHLLPICVDLSAAQLRMLVMRLVRVLTLSARAKDCGLDTVKRNFLEKEALREMEAIRELLDAASGALMAAVTDHRERMR